MFTNNLNGLAWVHPKALMPVLTNNNIYFGGKKKVSYSCTRSPSLMDHIILRALMKTDLICIVESIRDMYVDISCRKRKRFGKI
jgi:hypothetical protein